jgi:hypothetical protein
VLVISFPMMSMTSRFRSGDTAVSAVSSGMWQQFETGSTGSCAVEAESTTVFLSENIKLADVWRSFNTQP